MSTTSGVTSDDDFSDVSFYIVDDFPKPPSPLPTSDDTDDSYEVVDDVFLLCPSPSRSEQLEQLEHSEHRRPETSTSSLYSFFDEPPRLFCFDDVFTDIIIGDDVFHDDLSSRRRFETWAEQCMPRGATYADVSAAERLRNPKPTRDAPEIPSLFKKRDVGCGYCRSVGYRGAETHTRQTCRQLRQLAPCKICGASGAMNHTETYCPEKPSVTLSLSPEYLEALEKSRPTREFCFYNRHASLIEAIFG